VTINKAISTFQVLLDKYGSAYLTDEEVCDLLNSALRGEYLSRIFPDNQGGLANFEQDQNVLANIQPLVWTLSLNMNGSGILTNADINTALRAATGDSGDAYFRIAAIGWTVDGETIPVKFVRNNDRWSSERNVFKKPSSTNPKYSLIGSGLKFYPTSTSATLTVTVVKYPVLFDAANGSDECELGDYTMHNVLGIALKLAGVSVRDQELIEDVRLAGLQNSQ
jgi:hypothetical protein